MRAKLQSLITEHRRWLQCLAIAGLLCLVIAALVGRVRSDTQIDPGLTEPDAEKIIDSSTQLADTIDQKNGEGATQVDKTDENKSLIKLYEEYAEL